jgi:hypothetical protein
VAASAVSSRQALKVRGRVSGWEISGCSVVHVLRGS